jgi:hypothetical protein
MRGARIVLFHLAFSLLLAGTNRCEEPKSPKNRVCEAHSQKLCTCMGEPLGTQYCYADSKGWSPCDCLSSLR